LFSQHHFLKGAFRKPTAEITVPTLQWLYRMIAQVTAAFEVMILHSSCSGPFSELCDVCSGKATTATTGPHNTYYRRP